MALIFWAAFNADSQGAGRNATRLTKPDKFVPKEDHRYGSAGHTVQPSLRRQ